MLRSVLIANRGAVAARIIRACRVLDIRSVAVYSEADAGAPYLAMADQAVPIGPAAAAASYLNQDAVLAAAKLANVDAIHPGYGFLSENAGFAARVIAAGLTFIGPSPRWIEAMGHKTRARELVAKHGLWAAPGSSVLTDDAASMAAAAAAIGYPVLVKPAGGGGGIGMIAVHNEGQLAAAVERAPGGVVRRLGGQGDLAQVGIRGAGARQTEVLVDGIPLNPEGGAAVDLDALECSLPLNPPRKISVGILVNGRGERFINEDTYNGRIGLEILLGQDEEAYLVFDEEGYVVNAVGMRATWVCETATELAEEIGLPAGALQATLERYNEAAARGEDPEFHKVPELVRPLVPPLGAIDLRVANAIYAPFTLGGLDTTPDSEVRAPDGALVPGLYAAGRTTRGIAVRGYVSSISLGDGSFFGRRAGRAAASRA